VLLANEGRHTPEGVFVDSLLCVTGCEQYLRSMISGFLSARLLSVVGEVTLRFGGRRGDDDKQPMVQAQYINRRMRPCLESRPEDELYKVRC
jgi:hypothetical protein